MAYDIERIPIESLELDRENPRLAEFGITAKTPEPEVFTILWENMALEEIITSVAAHGFFDTEPLIAIKDKEKYIILEGNRRLAAVKIVRDTKLVDGKLDKAVLERIDAELISKLDKLPVIVVEDRQAAWRFIGFKHINGPAKWNSFAKAQHIAHVHKKYNISLDEIAFQVGDTHKTVQKLFQGIMVIEQAEREKIFDREDISKGRLYFSHLYTALQYEGFKDFLGINEVSMESQSPIPSGNKESLGEVLLWLYGSKKQDIKPVVVTQNPDLKHLESVIKDREAIAALRSGTSLSISYELSRPKSAVFEESLFSAKREIQKAWSFVNEGYSGSMDLLDTAKAILDIAEELHSRMEEKSNRTKRDKKGQSNNTKKRI